MPSVGRARCHPTAMSANRRFIHSPIDTLIDLVVWRWLRCLTPVSCPVRLDRNTFTDLRIIVIPQRRPVCRGNVRGLRVNPDVIEYLPDVGAVRDCEAIRPICPPPFGHSNGKSLVDSGDQHCPQVVR